MFWLGAILGFFLGELAMSGVLVLLAAGVRRQRVEPPVLLREGLPDEVPRQQAALPDEVLRDVRNLTAAMNAHVARMEEKRRIARARWN